MVRQLTVIRFGDFEVRPEAVELRRGSELVHLEPKVLQVLVYLLEHRDRVVTKNELLDAVWGSDIAVTTRTIDTHLKRLREKLGPASDLIETVRGVGYRFAE